ncbi:signal peptidase II [Corynebacterium sp. 335C]
MTKQQNRNDGASGAGRSAAAGAQDPATRPALRPRRGILALVAAVVVVIDQITKVLAVAELEGRPPVDVIGEWFQLTLLRNPGAAFSMGGEGSTWLFTTIQIVFIVAAIAVSGRLRTPWAAASVGLIAGGAAGNLIDRLVRDPGFYFGHVVDFLQVRGFAVFNIADCAITVGVVMLALWILFAPEHEFAKDPVAAAADSGSRDDAPRPGSSAGTEGEVRDA